MSWMLHTSSLVSVTRRDWSEYSKSVAIITVGLGLPVMMKLRGDVRPDVAEMLLDSMILCAGWVFAQSCFMNERFRGTVRTLLSLPLDPFVLATAKYVSIYTMVLVTINLPLILLRDWHLLLLANAVALFVATTTLSSTIVCRSKFSGQFPLFIILGLTFFNEDNLQDYLPEALPALHWVTSHATQLAAGGIILCPLIAVSSALLFRRRYRF